MKYKHITECPNCDSEITISDISNDDFDSLVLTLVGKSTMLSKEEEETIIKIAEKYKFI
jgi:hypothetical protein